MTGAQWHAYPSIVSTRAATVATRSTFPRAATSAAVRLKGHTPDVIRLPLAVREVQRSGTQACVDGAMGDVHGLTPTELEKERAERGRVVIHMQIR